MLSRLIRFLLWPYKIIYSAILKVTLKDVGYFFLIVLGLGSYGANKLLTPKPYIYIEKSRIVNTTLNSDSIIRPSKKQIDLFSKDDFARTNLNTSPASYFNIAIKDNYFLQQSQKYKDALNEITTNTNTTNNYDISLILRDVLSKYITEKKTKDESESLLMKFKKDSREKSHFLDFLRQKIKLYEDIHSTCILMLKDYLSPDNYVYQLKVNAINNNQTTLILSNKATIHGEFVTFMASAEQSRIYIDQNQHKTIEFTGHPPENLIPDKNISHDCIEMHYEFTILDRPWYFIDSKVEGIISKQDNTTN